MRRSGPGREVARASPRLATGVPDRVTGHDRGSALAITPDTTLALATAVDTSLDDVLGHVLGHVLDHVVASDGSPNASGDVQAAARRPGSRASGA